MATKKPAAKAAKKTRTVLTPEQKLQKLKDAVAAAEKKIADAKAEAEVANKELDKEQVEKFAAALTAAAGEAKFPVDLFLEKFVFAYYEGKKKVAQKRKERKEA